MILSHVSAYIFRSTGNQMKLTIKRIDDKDKDPKTEAQQRFIVKKKMIAKRNRKMQEALQITLPERRNAQAHINTGNDTQQLTTRTLTKKLQLNDLGLDDVYFEQFQSHNIPGTLFPINGVCYFVGMKGSGKTYMLSAIIQHAFKANAIRRLIYIYADNVDTTIIRALPRRYILSVPKEIAGAFLSKFLSKKTKYTSCYNFIYSAQHLPSHSDSDTLKLTNLYVDNLLEKIAARKHFTNVHQMKAYCVKTLRKYDSGTVLHFDNGLTYDLGRFDIDQYDLITIDDIGQFLDLFGTTRHNSELYRYFTITRQNKTAIYLTGQEIKQLPKMLREMLGAVVCLNGTNILELPDLKIPPDVIGQIQRFWAKIKRYEGVLYNFNDRKLEIIAD